MNKITKVLQFLGMVAGVTAFFVMTHLFYSAYQTSTKETCISIDSFGEAKFEFVMLVILFPIVIYAFFMGIKDLGDKK